jgi:preprotein translocase subunit SecG
MMPVPRSAEISTTGQPSSFVRRSMKILSPLFCTTSIMLTATTMGMPNSVNCVVR